MIAKIKKINNYTKHEINNFQNGKIKIVKSKSDIYKFTQESISLQANAVRHIFKNHSDQNIEVKTWTNSNN